MQASLFHLRYAALQGVPYALVALAKMHAGLEPSLAPFAAIFKAGAKAGVVWPDAAVADRLFELAAERGVRGAAVALATAAAAGAHVGGAPREPPTADGAAAAWWYAWALDTEAGDAVRCRATSAAATPSDCLRALCNCRRGGRASVIAYRMVAAASPRELMGVGCRG